MLRLETKSKLTFSLEEWDSLLQLCKKIKMFNAMLQIISVFSATIKVRQICLRQESCRESLCSVQLSCLRHICLTKHTLQSWRRGSHSSRMNLFAKFPNVYSRRRVWHLKTLNEYWNIFEYILYYLFYCLSK